MEEPLTVQDTHSLICAFVKRGYVEQAAEAARKAGATGGTILRARLTGAEDVAKFFGSVLSEEREVLTILAAANVRDGIMEALNASCGLHSPAEGLICSLPVEKAFKF